MILISTIVVACIIVLGGMSLIFTGIFINQTDSTRRFSQILFVVAVVLWILLKLGAIKDVLG